MKRIVLLGLSAVFLFGSLTTDAEAGIFRRNRYRRPTYNTNSYNSRSYSYAPNNGNVPGDRSGASNPHHGNTRANSGAEAKTGVNAGVDGNPRGT